MNRQKKELVKQIREIETWIMTDTELAYGCVPPGAYDRLYAEIDRLQEALARLMHYPSAMEMLCDERGRISEEEILRRAELEARRKAEKSNSRKPRKNSRGINR